MLSKAHINGKIHYCTGRRKAKKTVFTVYKLIFFIYLQSQCASILSNFRCSTSKKRKNPALPTHDLKYLYYKMFYYIFKCNDKNKLILLELQNLCFC